MIRKLWNVTKVEIDNEGNVSTSVITCNCKEKAEEEFRVLKGEVIAEYLYEDDEADDDFIEEDKGTSWVIKFPFEETKIVLKLEEAITNFDEDVETKHELIITWKNLDIQQEACIETLRDCFDECSIKDVELLKAVTICKDYIRDLKEDM